MADLDSAKRTLNRATYTPIKTTHADAPPQAGPRVVDKWGAIANVGINRPELVELRRRVTKLPAAQALLHVLDIVEQSGMTDPYPGTARQLAAMPLLQEVEAQDILTLGRELVQIRERHQANITKGVERVTGALDKAVSASPTPKTSAPSLPAQFKRISGLVNMKFPGSAVYGYSKTEKAKIAPPAGDVTGETKRGIEAKVIRQRYIMEMPPASTFLPLPGPPRPMVVRMTANTEKPRIP